MTLQELYDKAIELGATPESEVIVEYCSVELMQVHNGKIYID